MSSTRSFRVILNLSNFFFDHRSKARIFINKDIKRIRDLEERIEKVFQIENFHLICQNEFLPPTEDIRILQRDDIIWAIQNSLGQSCLSEIKTLSSVTDNSKRVTNKKRCVSPTDLEQAIHHSKKKKRKERDFEKSNTESSEKPKKKKKIKDIQDQADTTTEDKQFFQSGEKKKKKVSSNSTESKISDTLELTQNESNVMNINTLLPVLQLHINSYNKKINEKINKVEASTISSAETSLNHFLEKQNDSESGATRDSKEPYKCKGTLSLYKKKVSVPTITKKYLGEKKINIVKVEYLSGGPTQTKHITPPNSNNSNQCENSSQNNSESGNDLKHIYNDKGPIVQNAEQKINNVDVFEVYGEAEKMTSKNVQDASILQNNTVPIYDENFLSSSRHSSNTQDKRTINESVAKNSNGGNNKEYMEHEDKSTNSIVTNSFDSLSKNIYNINSDKSAMNASSNITEFGCNTKNTIKLSSLNDDTNATDKCFIPSENITEFENPRENLLSNEIIDEENDLVSDKSSISLNEINASLESHNNICELDFCDTSLTNRDADLPSEKKLFITENYEHNANQQSIQKNDFDNKIDDILQKTVSCNSGKNVEIHGAVPHQINNDFIKTDCRIRPSELENLTGKTDILNENVMSLPKDLNELTAMDETMNLENSNPSELSLIKNTTTSSDKLSTTSASVYANSSTFPSRKRLSGIGQLLGDLRSNESLVTGESMDSDHSEFVTKRQRKRVRKRKKKNGISSNTSLSDSSITITPRYVPKPLKTKACPTIHLKFEEEDGENLKAVDVNKKGNCDTEERESYVETSCIENITIESDGDESNLENFYVSEKLILKSPSIKNLLPKIGDIIAFKILRITENYTPEVSSYIIGRVLEFNVENKNVAFEILNGLDQCNEPIGRLMLEVDENNAANNKMQNFTWTDIIDPRLLFP